MGVDCQNSLPHMRGMVVVVGKNHYQLDENGIARDVDAEDSRKLINQPSGVWQRYTERQPVEGVQEAPEKPQEAPQAPEVPEEASKLEHAPGLLEIPGEGEDWPDPTEDMPLDYLQKMAEAYVVNHTAKTSKKKLIKDLLKAMY